MQRVFKGRIECAVGDVRQLYTFADPTTHNTDHPQNHHAHPKRHAKFTLNSPIIRDRINYTTPTTQYWQCE
jgi:hypothetical protein